MKYRNKGKKAPKISFLVSLVAFIVALAFLIYVLFNSYFIKDNYDKFQNSSSETSSAEVKLVENPINFEELKQTNTDIYAWIKISNTNIDYPVLQSTTEGDNFYLNHGTDKKYKYAGSIFSEMKNSKDFSDPNTVLYGHNMLNGSMFQNLHKFKDKEFFDANKYIYIYTPKHILTYEICAAYKYDNRHILNSFDFTDKEVFKEYLEYVKNPKSMLVNTREVELNTESKLLTLSTCIGDKNYRYLVQGVLVKDELTKQR